jgi:hypothetical protein
MWHVGGAESEEKGAQSAEDSIGKGMGIGTGIGIGIGIGRGVGMGMGIGLGRSAPEGHYRHRARHRVSAAAIAPVVSRTLPSSRMASPANAVACDGRGQGESRGWNSGSQQEEEEEEEKDEGYVKRKGAGRNGTERSGAGRVTVSMGSASARQSARAGWVCSPVVEGGSPRRVAGSGLSPLPLPCPEVTAKSPPASHYFRGERKRDLLVLGSPSSMRGLALGWVEWCGVEVSGVVWCGVGGVE